MTVSTLMQERAAPAVGDRRPQPTHTDAVVMERFWLPDLKVEDMIVEAGRDAEGDPAIELHFKVRNVGASMIERYFVNVWHLLA